MRQGISTGVERISPKISASYNYIEICLLENRVGSITNIFETLLGAKDCAAYFIQIFHSVLVTSQKIGISILILQVRKQFLISKQGNWPNSHQQESRFLAGFKFWALSSHYGHDAQEIHNVSYLLFLYLPSTFFMLTYINRTVNRTHFTYFLIARMCQ